MATSGSTALAAIRTEAKIGRSTETNRGTSGEPVRTRGPSRRARTTNTSTGTPMVPITPSGSRTKILISSQVSRQSPRNVPPDLSVANRVAGELQKHVLERRDLRAEVCDLYAVLRHAANDLGDEIVTPSTDCDLRSVGAH